MSTPRSQPPIERRPFQDQLKVPEAGPFYRTPEFKRSAALFGIVLLFGVGAIFMLWIQQPGPARPLVLPLDLRPAVTAEEIEARAVRKISLFQGALRDSENGDPLRESEGYRQLGQALLSYSPFEITEKTQRELSYPNVLKDPDAWRGEFVRWRGVVGDLWPNRLRDPILGRTDVYRGIMVSISDEKDENGEDITEAVLFDVFDKPPSLTQHALRREAVDLEGILYRTVSYMGADGQSKLVPYLLVRNVAIVDNTSGTSRFLRDNTIVLVAGLAFAVLTSALVLSWLNKRNARKPRKASAKPATIREMLEAQVSEPGSTPPPPPSS